METTLFLDYRVRVTRIALAVSWGALLLFGVWLILRVEDAANLLILLVLLTVALIVLTLIPWRRALTTSLGDAVIALWGVAAVGALVMVDQAQMDSSVVLGFLMVVVFASATLISIPLLLTVTATAAAGYAYTLVSLDELTTGGFLLSVVAFLAAAALVDALSLGVKGELGNVTTQLSELADREQELAETQHELRQLYEVSRTIGVGSNLAEVLPELVGRLALAVDARVGLVLLYRARDEALEVMSPIWVAGHTVRAERYSLALIEPGLPQSVFKSGGPVIDNHIAPEDLTDPLLSDLSPTSITAVPLRIEARPVGVLLVADKNSGEFSADDAVALEALAGPAALVLNQMARYEEARASGEKMAELAQLKTDFVSVVSHELRTPLTSIIGSLITLQRPELEPPDSNARELIASAAKQANRLKTLIEDLLVVSRLESKTFPVRLQQLQPDLYFPEMLASIPRGQERVRLLIEEGIGVITADPDHLSRIITNLVDNALKYGGDGPIELHAKRVGTTVQVSVIDHGPGIPYDRRDHVFERFTQLQPAETRIEGGTGLGLSIVKGLADSLGARVWFEPTIGGGATFTLALPSDATPAVAVGSA